VNAAIAELQQVRGPPKPASNENRAAEEEAVAPWLEDGMLDPRQMLGSTTALAPAPPAALGWEQQSPCTHPSSLLVPSHSF